MNSKEKSINQEISKSDIKALESFNISHKTLFNNLIYGKKRQNMENLLYKDHRKIIDGEVQFQTLGDVALLYEINEKNDKDTLLISTCKTCNSKIVHYNQDIDDFRNEIFIEMTNNLQACLGLEFPIMVKLHTEVIQIFSKGERINVALNVTATKCG